MSAVNETARIGGLRRIAIATSDLSRSADFYQSVVGFKARDASDGQAYFDLGQRTNGELRLHLSATDTMTQLTFEVATLAELETIVQRLDRENVRISRISCASLGDDAAIIVNDPDGNAIELVVPSAGSANDYRSGDTKRLGHVVLWTPDTVRMEKFFELIGFRVSDRTHLGMSFLRCNTDHHTVGLARSNDGRSGLQHVAFDVGGEETVIAEKLRLSASGVDCIWGPGRHGPGNNVFSYYTDPGANIFELYGDMERVTDTKPVSARFWGTEHRGDISGKAGPLPSQFRS